MAVQERQKSRMGMRRTVSICMIIGLLLTTGWFAMQLGKSGSRLANTLQTVENGKVPLEQARYDLERLHFASDQDAEEIRDMYRQMWTTYALILGIGFLLLFASKKGMVLGTEDMVA